jgi:hypothetical protein
MNLNASGDTHVSFFARHLVPSPCGRFLLVSTDTGRMVGGRVTCMGASGCLWHDVLVAGLKHCSALCNLAHRCVFFRS